MLLLDPFPVDNPSMSPELPKMPPGGPFGGGPPPEPKGDLRPLLDLVGLDWPSTEIVWNVYNPHPKLADLQSTPEIVFIGKGSGAPDAFNEEQSASAGLQEIVTLFPGYLRPKTGAGHRLHPALADRATGGTVAWSDVVQQGFMGISGINPRRRHIPTGKNYTLAARITGQVPSRAPQADKIQGCREEKGREARSRPRRRST